MGPCTGLRCLGQRRPGRGFLAVRPLAVDILAVILALVVALTRLTVGQLDVAPMEMAFGALGRHGGAPPVAMDVLTKLDPIGSDTASLWLA